jgi:hypothetical protein
VTIIELLESKREHIQRLANQRGAAGEASALARLDNCVPRPRGLGLKILLSALLKQGVRIKATSFDAIQLPHSEGINFTDLEAVERDLDQMVFIEIKTANQKRVKPDFTGFFFALSENEIAASEALGWQHRVVLINNITGEVVNTSVSEIISKAKSSTWQLSVQL